MSKKPRKPRKVSARAAKKRNIGGSHIVGRKRAEEALKKAHDELELRVEQRTTELNVAMATIQRERQRLYDVLETLPVYVILLSKDYHVPFANRFFRERFGESGGRCCFDYLFKRTEPCENCETFKVLKTNTPHHWEWTGPDGRNYDIYDFPFTDADGSALILEMGIDITETKQAQVALRQINVTLESRVAERTAELAESEARFKAIAETTPVSIGVVGTPDSIFLYVNPAYEKAFGYSEAELLGKGMLDIYWSPEDRDRLLACLKEKSSVTEYEVKLKRKDGTPFWGLISATPINYGGKQAILGAIIDITERKLAEERLSTAKLELEEMNKELEAFSHTVSHDLKGPLRSIQGFAQALADDCKDRLDDAGRDFVRRIGSASERMTQLIDAILAIGSLTNRELLNKSVDLSLIAEAIADDLKKNEPDRRVDFRLSKGIRVQGDMDMLEIVLRNLFDNAWKFTAKNAVAAISFGSMQTEGKDVYFVRDDGTGFSMEFAEKLFMPFKRLHPAAEFPGLGIGLATVRKIIFKHGGKIWAESEPGKGATFYFTLN